MKVGQLSSSVLLDGPTPYCGSIIRGSVQVKFSQGNSDQEELFGPLVVSITVSGRLKTKIKVSTGQSTTNYRARVPLFSRRQAVYNGPVRLARNQAAKYPFEFVFPAQPSNPSGYFQPSLAFNTDPNQSLPPSMDYSYVGFSRNAEAHVQYGIDVHLSTPGVEVDIPDPVSLFSTQPQMSFRWERGPVTTALPENPTVAKGSLFFKDKRLIPESLRPQPKGFKEKTSALFTHTPRPSLSLTWSLTSPTTCHRGQPFLVHVQARPKPEDSTAPELPLIRLLRVEASVKQFVICRAEATFGDKVHDGDGHAASDHVVFSSSSHQDMITPFEERDQWTKTVALMNLTGRLGTEVRTAVVTRRYTVKVSATLDINGRTEVVKRTSGLVIAPPLATAGGGVAGQQAQAPTAAEVGGEPTSLEVPSQPQVGGSEPLPAYEETAPAGGSADAVLGAPLPVAPGAPPPPFKDIA